MRWLTPILFLIACGDPAPTPAPEPAPEPAAEPAAEEPKAAAIDPLHTSLFKPLTARMETTPSSQAQIDLGRMLYYDSRLSLGQDISCNSCHQLDKYGADGEATSPGHKGARGDRNSPTSFNAAAHIAQFWDGRAADVEAQAKGPVLNPGEMAMPSEEHVVTVLASIPGYVEAFGAAFPGEEAPVSYDNMANAIGAFERGLVTPSPFDAYLEGDASALSDAQMAGLGTFIETGCATCHMGPAIGGGMYQKLGLVHPYETEDEGRKKVTGKDSDAFLFKVPSLRNVTETGPYFHDGSVATLSEAIRLMGYHQLGKELTAEQIASIETFLGALKGTVDEAYTAKPELPESGPTTPGPSM